MKATFLYRHNVEIGAISVNILDADTKKVVWCLGYLESQEIICML